MIEYATKYRMLVATRPNDLPKVVLVDAEELADDSEEGGFDTNNPAAYYLSHGSEYTTVYQGDVEIVADNAKARNFLPGSLTG